MSTTTDILLGKNDELLFRNGDLLVDESTSQHIKDILEAAPGHYKQFPLMGANILSQVNSPLDPSDFRHLIRLQLQADGMKVNAINIKNNEIKIDAGF